MGKTPKVSIVIPMYNVEKYLDNCLKSAIRQSLKDIEIICVDDGSTDNTRIVAEKYAAMDNRVCLIYYDINMGQSYARNKAIEICRGEYIQFLDSDDSIPVYSTEKLYTCAKAKSCDVVVFNLKTTYEKEEYREVFSDTKFVLKDFENKCYQGMEAFKLFRRNSVTSASICTACLFCKRDFLINNKIKFLEGIIYEDDLFSFQVLMTAKKVSCVYEPCYYRLKRAGSTTTSPLSNRDVKSRFIIYCSMVEWLYKNTIPKEYYIDIIEHIAQIYSVAKRVAIEGFSELYVGNEYFSSFWQGKLFDLFLFQSAGGYIRNLSCQEIENIKKSSMVIVYGAGRISRDAIFFLSSIGVNKFCIAVTKTNENEWIMGNKVYNISDVECDKNNAVVLIAVKGIAGEEIYSNLLKMGYKYVIKLTNN